MNTAVSSANPPAAVAAGSNDPNRRVIVMAVAILALGFVYVAQTVSVRHAVLLLIGGGLGLVLYHALFGFTSAWRVFLSDGRGAGLRAQMLMLAVASVLFLPALAEGNLFGRQIVGAVAPVGVSVVLGAFLFGIGMQLGGGCASGTLYTAGSGNVRMLVTLAAFIAGSVIATLHMPWWFKTPNIGAVSLIKELGLAGGLALQLAVFAAITAFSVAVERRRHGRLLPARTSPYDGWRRLLRGPWPLLWGALGLAGLNFATLAVAGHPWGDHLRLLPLGGEDGFGGGHRRRVLDLLDLAVPRARAPGERVCQHHVGDEFRYPARCAAGGWVGGQVRAQLAHSPALVGRRGDRWAVDGLRRPSGVRLQYRCVLQRCRLGQPTRLGVVRLRLRRFLPRNLGAAAVRARGRTQQAERLLVAKEAVLKTKSNSVAILSSAGTSYGANTVLGVGLGYDAHQTEAFSSSR